MAEDLTREQFQAAVADAVAGVLNVYREVDTMLRELGTALAEAPPAFAQVKRVVPGAGRKNPDARYLRNYVAAFYMPASVADEEEDDEDDEGEDDDEESSAPNKKVLSINKGGSILIASAAIYDRNVAGFEPNLLVAALTKCRSEPDVPADSVFKVPRARLKRIVRAVGVYKAGSGKPLRTEAIVQVDGQPKGRAKHMLVFDVAEPLQRYPLFEVTPERIAEIAATVRAAWTSAGAAGYERADPGGQ
jgi:hypothetical protein